MSSIYGDSIFESMETDIKNKNDAQQALRNGDIESAKAAANNVSDSAKKSTIKNEIKRKEDAIKAKEKANNEE
jgi:hypothetical protein